MINKLILGTVQLGLDYGINNNSGKPSLSEAFKILHTAYDNGVRTLDTAEAYGESQEVIGEFQKKYPQKKFNIITKLAANYILKADDFSDHIKKNIKILNTKELYGYMFHNYQSFKKNESLYNEILIEKKKGLIKKAGISLYSNVEIEDIINNYSQFDFIQIPFNLFDNEFKRIDVIKKAKEKNIEIHTRSVFLQGLFFKDFKDLPEKLKPLAEKMKILEAIKNNNKINIESLALQYVLQKDYIDFVLVGVENDKQLLSNIDISSKKVYIPNNIIDKINVDNISLLNPSNWN